MSQSEDVESKSTLRIYVLGPVFLFLPFEPFSGNFRSGLKTNRLYRWRMRTKDKAEVKGTVKTEMKGPVKLPGEVTLHSGTLSLLAILRGFRRIHVFVFRYRWTENGFTARKAVSGAFEKWAPDPKQCPKQWLVTPAVKILNGKQPDNKNVVNSLGGL